MNVNVEIKERRVHSNDINVFIRRRTTYVLGYRYAKIFYDNRGHRTITSGLLYRGPCVRKISHGCRIQTISWERLDKDPFTQCASGLHFCSSRINLKKFITFERSYLGGGEHDYHMIIARLDETIIPHYGSFGKMRSNRILYYDDLKDAVRAIDDGWLVRER